MKAGDDMKKINIGVIGSGFIVPVFIRQTKAFPQFRLCGIWGRHMEKLEQYREDFEYLTTDLEEILIDEKIDTIYIALPNALHYAYAMKALEHGKNVIVEKPFTVTVESARKLISYARKRKLIIYEAIMTLHNPLYCRARDRVRDLGEIKVIACNFSQYSRRYDRFREGVILPAFDQRMAGGALYDLGIYNIHFVTGIFGKPKKVRYFANITKGVDTSGTLVLDYGDFKAVCINAKDCKSESYGMVEGDKGYLRFRGSTSRCCDYIMKFNDGKQEHRSVMNDEFVGWRYELKEFQRIYNSRDLEKAYAYNKQTLISVDVLEKAMKDAGLNYKEEKI